MMLIGKDCFVVSLLAMTLLCVIASRPERGALSVEAKTGGSWIPGLALLARNDGLFQRKLESERGWVHFVSEQPFDKLGINSVA